MNLCKFITLTVILIVNVSCQQIVDSLTPTNLLSPSILAHYKQQQQQQQQNLQFKHHIPDFDVFEDDNNSLDLVTTTTTTTRTDSDSNLSLLDIIKNQILANNFIESNKKVAELKNNKTKNSKENFVKNFIFYKWLTNQRDHSPHNSYNKNSNVDDSWTYYDDSGDDDSINSNDFEILNQDKRSALRSAMSRRSQKKKEMGDSFLPSVSVGEFPGAMSNLDDFFSQLNTNIKTLETTPNYHHITFDDVAYLENQIANNKKEYTNDYYVKPSGTAAFLHAIRSYRPSQKIRALVAMQPESYRGANFLDPNYLWQGLGK